MRIIALQGKHNSGKTATLKNLIEILHNPEDGFVFEGVYPKGDVLDKDEKARQEMVNNKQATMILKELIELKEEIEV